MSRILSDLDLKYIDGKTWQLIAPFVAESDNSGVLTVDAGETTDFNSIPRAVWNLLPPEEYGEAAVLHDHLYRYGMIRGNPIDRIVADQVHREFVQFRHAPKWKVAIFYYGLRLGGFVAWNRYRKNPTVQT